MCACEFMNNPESRLVDARIAAATKIIIKEKKTAIAQPHAHTYGRGHFIMKTSRDKPTEYTAIDICACYELDTIRAICNTRTRTMLCPSHVVQQTKT